MEQLKDFLETEVTIIGAAVDALSSLNGRTSIPGLRKSIKVRAKVRYPYKFGVEEYQFPVIEAGNDVGAKQSLELLRKQRAVSECQYTLLSNVIEIAREASI